MGKSKKETEEMGGIRISTPVGTLIAERSTDPDLPGISLFLEREDPEEGKKFKDLVGVLEYDTEKNHIRITAWGDEDPEGMHWQL